METSEAAASAGYHSNIVDHSSGVIVVTLNDIPGYRIVRVLGTVYGMTVNTRNWGTAVGAIVRSVAGGEMRPITTLAYRVRNAAVERMIGDCLGHGGNAIVAQRFETSEVGPFMSASAYGTACVVERLEGTTPARSGLLAE